MHPTFDLGFLQLPAMGACILCGTVLTFLLLFLLRKKTTLKPEQTLDGMIWAILLGFAGMKILYWIVSPPAWPTNFSEVLSLLAEGMVFYGGLIGGLLGILICAWRKKVHFFEYTDYFAPAFCLAHAGGRIGCLLAGCCYGMELSPLHPLSIRYPDLPVSEISGTWRLAVPVMEAVFLVLLAVVLSLLLMRRKKRGFVVGMYLLLYSVWRFVIEAFRGDVERGFLGALSTSQWISLAMFAGAIVLIILSRRWDLPSLAEKDETPEKTDEAPETTEEAAPAAEEEASAAESDEPEGATEE
ncbi:MAG: prolipoprotein diacylglyceryl transferase [Clostridiales bacterium]|nr:prolipoprotein diacylglyceryl transferase [Clostridiales bacterium]